jgi:hypothetical protein
MQRGKRRGHSAYTEAQRRSILAQAAELRSKGLNTGRVALEVGVAPQTLTKWEDMAATTGVATFRAVEVVVPAPIPTPVLVSPNGFRIEGLSLDGLAALLRELG